MFLLYIEIRMLYLIHICFKRFYKQTSLKIAPFISDIIEEYSSRILKLILSSRRVVYLKKKNGYVKRILNNRAMKEKKKYVMYKYRSNVVCV
jgi:hypothetical protein